MLGLTDSAWSWIVVENLVVQTWMTKETFGSKIVARSVYTKETSYVSVCCGFDKDIL